jgi:DNA-binding response OmpR family regulator
MANGTRNVLVVEDQVLIGLEMQDTLTALGYRVVGPFANMAAGLNAAATQDIDFALLDFDLGHGEDSTPIAKALTSRGLPFAFVTGTESSVVRASFGKSIVLAKPVDERLLDRLLSAA